MQLIQGIHRHIHGVSCENHQSVGQGGRDGHGMILLRLAAVGVQIDIGPVLRRVINLTGKQDGGSLLFFA